VAQAPQPLAEQLVRHLQPHFDELITTTLHTAPATPPATEPSSLQPASAEEAAPVPPPVVAEWRLLARRHHQGSIWLRPLLLLGLLVALMAVWIILLVGWEVTPPLLAPGDEYRATTQRLAFAYRLSEEKETLLPTLSVELGETPQQLPLGESRQFGWGQIVIQAHAGAPALLIRSTDEAVTLSRLGQTQRTANLGLIFPSLGSEDSVVVADSVGLRVVRMAVLPAKENTSGNANNNSMSPLAEPQEHFLVEVYQSDETKPVQTIYVSQQMSATIQVSGAAREIWFIPLPSMAAAVRYQPGIWLLWLAIGLVLLGAVGYRYQPAFLVVQIAAWPMARAVIVAQSDLAADLERIRQYLVVVDQQPG